VQEAKTTCPRYHHAVELIGARWSGAILRALLEGRERYAEVKAYVPGLSDTMLAQRLRELEQEGLVERRVEPSTPVRVTYHLTAKGRALGPVVKALEDWAHDWLPAGGDASRRQVS
jgi:DNA-binding HxlR family transcriptional regulator